MTNTNEALAQAIPAPGALIRLRSATWKVLATSTLKLGYREVHCRGLSGLVRDSDARFFGLSKGPTFREHIRLRGYAAKMVQEEFVRGNYAAHI